MRTALVIGSQGQDGSYMFELLQKKGYNVWGTYRPGGTTFRIPVRDNDHMQPLDLQESPDKIAWLLAKIKPDEIYNLAGQTFQGSSWAAPSYTLDLNAGFVMRLLEAVHKVTPKARVFQASAAGMFGDTAVKCDENTPINAHTPYDVAKAAAHRLCQIYRENGMWIATGILFSHESPRRGIEMVSRKISQAVAHWSLGHHQFPLALGGMDFEKDWGYAPDFVQAMYNMLQVNDPNDYVLGTGVRYSVRDFVQTALEEAGVKGTPEELVHIEPAARRKHAFSGYAFTNRAERLIGWNNYRTQFRELVKIMVEADVEKLKKG